MIFRVFYQLSMAFWAVWDEMALALHETTELLPSAFPYLPSALGHWKLVIESYVTSVGRQQKLHNFCQLVLAVGS
jgi:hypothetical protein